MATTATRKTNFIVITGEGGIRKSEVVQTLVRTFKPYLMAPTIHTTGISNNRDLVCVDEREFVSLEPTMIVTDVISGVRYGLTTEVFLSTRGRIPVLRLRPEVARAFQAQEGRDHVHLIQVGPRGIKRAVERTRAILEQLVDY